MDSKIEQLIDEIEDYIESCKPKMLSSDIILVNKDEIMELLRDLRMKTPDEIKRYQKIITQRDSILNDARNKAQQLINEAAVHTNELVSESEIMQQAQDRANEMLQAATQQAQEILDQAAMEANAMRQAAIDYTDAQLCDLENKLSHAVDIAGLNYEKLIAQLNQDIQGIQINRAQLQPQEEAVEEAPESTAVEAPAPNNVTIDGMPDDLESILTEKLDVLTQ